MNSDFPVVCVVGDENISRGLIAPAMALGVELKFFEEEVTGSCNVLTVVGGNTAISKIRTWEARGLDVRPSAAVMSKRQLAESGDYFVLVARSPHDQGSVWTPVEKFLFGNSLAVTTSSSLSEGQVAQVQKMALEKAREIELVGVACVGLTASSKHLEISSLTLGPSRLGDWSIAGSRTCQYEQHLRAILDLPLGETHLSAQHVVAGFFKGKIGSNMYRPYLHLMAASPGLKFQQYLPTNEGPTGHVTAMGNSLLELRKSVSHAVEYMNGEIDE